MVDSELANEILLCTVTELVSLLWCLPDLDGVIENGLVRSSGSSLRGQGCANVQPICFSFESSRGRVYGRHSFLSVDLLLLYKKTFRYVFKKHQMLVISVSYQLVTSRFR